LAHLRSISQGVEIPSTQTSKPACDRSGRRRRQRCRRDEHRDRRTLDRRFHSDVSSPLFDFSLAVERIQAARRAIDDSGTGILLTGRSEGFRVGRPDLSETIRRLTASPRLGPIASYAPGLLTMNEIRAVRRCGRAKPVNVLVGSDFATVAELAQAGVRRISVGGALARAAWAVSFRRPRKSPTMGHLQGSPAPFRCRDQSVFDSE